MRSARECRGHDARYLTSNSIPRKEANGRARWREGERLKRFGEHFVEVFSGGDAGGDMRIEMLAGSLRNEPRDVIVRWLGKRAEDTGLLT